MQSFFLNEHERQEFLTILKKLVEEAYHCFDSTHIMSMKTKYSALGSETIGINTKIGK